MVFAPPPVFLDELSVRKLLVGILVQRLEVRVRGRGVEVVVALLDVFAVVSLAVRQAKQPFLQNRVASVPQRERKTQDLLVVADAEDPVLAPPVRAAASRVVAERIPGGTAGAVVLTNRAPLALAQIWPPRLPAVGCGIVQAFL